MTLVDTSVIIDYLRSGDVKFLNLFQSLPGCICGTVKAEVLHGTRNAADRNRLLALLNAFAQTVTPELVWDAVGDLLAVLRKNGITVPFNDVVIASVAVATGVELWTHDKQFQLIQQHEPRLRLFQELP